MAKMQYTGNVLSRPRWAGDWLDDEALVPAPFRLDAAQFTDQAGIVVTVDTGGAAQNATSVPVVALALPNQAASVAIAAGSVLIPAGSVVWFGGAKYARLTADALLGATTLSVSALPTALVAGDVATYSRFGTTAVRSGTVVGRTYAERDAGTNFGPAAATDDEIFLVAFDKPRLADDSDFEAYRPNAGLVVYVNFLPDYAALSAAGGDVQTVTVTGTPTGGTFTLSYKGAVTTALAYNAAASAVQAALRALATIGGTNATVTGSAGGPYAVTLAAGLAPFDMLAADPDLLTGGTPAITVARTTPGGTPLLTKLRQLYNCQLVEP